MNTDKILIISLILSMIGTSFGLTGCIMICIAFSRKVSNFSGNRHTLVPPSAFFIIFISSLIFSLSDIYESKWILFFVQILVSSLNLCIYIIHKKTYRQRLEDEIR